MKTELELINSMCDDYGAEISIDDFNEWFAARQLPPLCVSDEAMRLLTLFVIESKKRDRIEPMIIEDDHRIRTIINAVEWSARERTINDIARYLGVTATSLDYALIDELDPVPDLNLRLPECDE